MTPSEITQVSSVLAMLRQSNAMHLAGDSEQAIDMERDARIKLVGLLQANGVATDQVKLFLDGVAEAKANRDQGSAP